MDRIRGDLKKLIDNLSKLYLQRLKENELNNRKANPDSTSNIGDCGESNEVSTCCEVV